MTKNKTNIDKCVGIKDGTLYFVNYIFEDEMHGKPFCGATGYVFSPISQEYIDQMRDAEYMAENYDYIWKEAVQSGQTEKGLKEYMEEMTLCEDCNGEGQFVGHDTSGIWDIPDEIKEQYFPDAATFECIGAGRCFGADMEFDIVLEPEILEEIRRVEGKAQAA